MVLGIQNYISKVMGQKYIEPPPFDLPLSFYFIDKIIMPMIFIVSRNRSDESLSEFAAEKKMSKKYSALSLGKDKGRKPKN